MKTFEIPQSTTHEWLGVHGHRLSFEYGRFPVDVGPKGPLTGSVV